MVRAHCRRYFGADNKTCDNVFLIEFMLTFLQTNDTYINVIQSRESSSNKVHFGGRVIHWVWKCWNGSSMIALRTLNSLKWWDLQ